MRGDKDLMADLTLIDYITESTVIVRPTSAVQLPIHLACLTK